MYALFVHVCVCTCYSVSVDVEHHSQDKTFRERMRLLSLGNSKLGKLTKIVE